MLDKVLAVLLLCASGATQTKAPKAKHDVPKPPPPVFEIKLSEDADFVTMPWANDWPIQAKAIATGTAICMSGSGLRVRALPVLPPRESSLSRPTR